MDDKEGIRRVLDGDGLLFLGAGFSLGATNLRNKRLMSGKAIADHFASLAHLKEGTGLEDAAEAYAENEGVDALIREVQEEFTVQSVADFHRQIAALPWRRVYTTNYDNVFEVASRLERKRVTSVTLGNDIYAMPKDHLICVHLNGFVEGLDRKRIMTELKLTDTSYVSASVADSEWAMLFRQDMKLASAVFFVGYSLFDIDIRRILTSTDDLQEKLLFYLGPSPDEVTQKRVGRYGSPISASTLDLSRSVKEVAANHIPRRREELLSTSVRELKAPFAPARITDRSFIDLLLWGQRSTELINESLRTSTKYYLCRAQIEQALDAIKMGSRIVVVTSDLGNGKSMLLEGMRLAAVEQGFRVFEVYDNNKGVEGDLEAIASCGEKVLVTIEEYQNWLDHIRLFSTSAGDQATLVLTARSAVHDVLIDDLTAIVGAKPVTEINIDTLTDQDIAWVVDALDQYGLWGSRAGLGRGEKTKLLQENCRRQLHAILLNLLKSPDIGKRVNDVAERIRSKGENYEPLLSIFILTLLNYGPTLDVLVDIWGTDRIGNPQFRTDPIAKELVSFNSYAVVVRSPIAAEYILSSFTDAGTVVSVLTRMAERIEKGANVSARYENLFKNLMRFSNLQALLPEDGRRPAVIKYYESLKNLQGCRSNPLFWLQYGIASLVIEDLPRAETYFDTAYALAAKKGWDTFQIDNHFSRLLMVKAVRDLDFDAAMSNYRRARSILDRQMRDERRHYPYRVAIHYQEFFNRFGSRMSITEVRDFAESANRILERISELPEHRRFHRHVRECREAMQYVVGVCADAIERLSASPPNGEPRPDK